MKTNIISTGELRSGEVLATGFNTLTKVPEKNYIFAAYCHDNGFYQAILQGYKIVYDAALMTLFEDGYSKEDADSLIVLREFFKEVEAYLDIESGGRHE